MVDQSKPPDGPAPIPADDPGRSATIVHADAGDIPHISLAGDTYTILLKGDDTAGRYTLIDMRTARWWPSAPPSRLRGDVHRSGR